jgi:nitrogen fixation-related uncharacterized protein
MKINYKKMKHVVVALQVFNVPFSVYSGAMLALGEPKMFLTGLSISMVFVFVQAHLWWVTMEKLQDNNNATGGESKNNTYILQASESKKEE